MQVNRRTLYTVGIAVILFFMFFNPFKKKDSNDAVRPYVSSETETVLAEYVESNYMTPEDLILSLFDNHDVVLVGELSQIKQQVDVIHNVIPMLYEQGVTNLAIEYALIADQDAIDEVTTAETYDQEAVNKILFNRMVIFGYQDYADLFKTVWNLNRSLPEGSKIFRIIGMNVTQDWSVVSSERDLKKPEIVAQVFAEGVPDVRMAEAVEEEVLDKGEKALVLVSSRHAFTDFEVKKYTENAEESGLADTRLAGNIIHEMIGSRAATVLFHAPWEYSKAQLLSTFPADGAFDNLMDELPEERMNLGLLMTSPELIEIDAGRNDYDYGYDDLKVSDMCDGYILTGPFTGYQIVDPIEGFITEDNIADAITYFPGANPGNITAEEMNEYIAGIAVNRKTFLEKFK